MFKLQFVTSRVLKTREYIPTEEFYSRGETPISNRDVTRCFNEGVSVNYTILVRIGYAGDVYTFIRNTDCSFYALRGKCILDGREIDEVLKLIGMHFDPHSLNDISNPYPLDGVRNGETEVEKLEREMSLYEDDYIIYSGYSEGVVRLSDKYHACARTIEYCEKLNVKLCVDYENNRYEVFNRLDFIEKLRELLRVIKREIC